MGSQPPGPPRPSAAVPKELLKEWADEARGAGLERLAQIIERFLKDDSEG